MRNIFRNIFFVLCIIGFSCSSQKKMQQIDTANSFALLKEKMDKTLVLPGNRFYKKYDGKIVIQKIEDNYIFHYNYNSANYEIIVSDKYYSDYISLFEDGLLYPGLIGGCYGRSQMSVGQFKEMRITSNETRHYVFWSWCSGVLNPCEYTIKLLNKDATESTTTKDFLQNATIVSVSPCSVII